ncbi:hypothetical protein K0U00_27535, partial [Paenibacillus sepulcri]|nr:hypothetical protein [Paenibacillus sepulcri]
MGVKTHTKKDQGPGLKNRTGIFAALIVVTLAAAAGLWQASQNQPDGSESSHLLADFTAFWGWGDREFAEGAQQAGWTFRWDGEAAADTANRLAERLHIVMSPISSPLGEAYQGSIGGGTDNPAVTIWYQEQADRQKNPSEGASIQEDGNAPVQLIILLQPDKGSKLDIIKASAAEIEEMAVEEEVP